MLSGYIKYVHVKDALWKNGQVVPAGKGDGHVKEILQKLDKAGYSGCLSLEPHLAEFATLQSLEHRSDKKETSDGVWAFTTAYQALKKLLETL